MKYAIIADVHGNYHGLRAVIEDGIRREVDFFIFAGDYYGDMPYINEINELISSVPGYIVRGNKEDYLTELHMSARSQWTHIQFASLYWSYDECSEKNLFEMINLPEDVTIIDETKQDKIFVTHSITSKFDKCNLSELTSNKFACKMDSTPFTHQDYLEYINELLCDDNKLKTQIDQQSPNIYIFGHTHLQWHTYVGNTLFINPGSCGKPLDYDQRAPYTILEIRENETVINEIRVEYDVEKAIEGLQQSLLYDKATDWSRIVIGELKNARDDISFFFKHLTLVSQECGEDSWPVSTFVWKEAISRWKDK